MEGLADPEAFKACYAQFRKSDEDRDVLITQLLDSYEDLQIRYRRVMSQLENERETREIWQRESRDARKQLNQSKLANVSPVPPFLFAILPLLPARHIHLLLPFPGFRVLCDQYQCHNTRQQSLSPHGNSSTMI